MTRTGRSRLEHRHGWLDAVMVECPCSQGWREGTFQKVYQENFIPTDLYDEILLRKIRPCYGGVAKAEASLYSLVEYLSGLQGKRANPPLS